MYITNNFFFFTLEKRCRRVPSQKNPVDTRIDACIQKYLHAYFIFYEKTTTASCVIFHRFQFVFSFCPINKSSELVFGTRLYMKYFF